MLPITRTADQLIPALAVRQRQLFTAGAVGAAVSIVGLVMDRRAFFEAYLMAFMYILALTLGCLALGMVHQLSGGAWGVVIRRPLGAATRTLPLVTLLFLPIAFGMRQLYIWTDPALLSGDEALRHKQAYLNVPFFLVRAAVYFTVWNLLTHYLNKWSLQQDARDDPRLARKMQLLSAGGLVAYGLTMTFAAVDWLMSLEPHWFSTIYGVLIFGGQALSGIAFMIAVLVWLSRRPPLDRVVLPAHFHDLGNLMLAFVMLWAYFAFSQYLIIWSGNLPEEIAWYAHRLQTGWRGIGAALIMFHFAVPFCLLLSRTVKREPAIILRVVIGVLIVRLVDLYWLIGPEFHQHGIAISWLDVLLPLTLVTIWLGAFTRQLRGRAILPVHDPEFDETLGPILDRVGDRLGERTRQPGPAR